MIRRAEENITKLRRDLDQQVQLLREERDTEDRAARMAIEAEISRVR